MSLQTSISYNYIIKPKPISAIWSIGENEFPGNLDWEGGKPRLTIHDKALQYDSTTEQPNSILERFYEEHSSLNIFTEITEYGGVFLEGCLVTEFSSHYSVCNDSYHTRCVLLPGRFWFSSVALKTKTPCLHSKCIDKRIRGIFPNETINSINKNDENFRNVYTLLDNPDAIWAARSPNIYNTKLGQTDFELSIMSSLSNSFDVKEGTAIKFVPTVDLRGINGEELNIGEHLNAIKHFENMISVLSLSHFEFTHIQFEIGENDYATLVWSRGEKKWEFEPPDPFQVPINLATPHNIETAIASWFSSSQELQRSLWIFDRALHEQKHGIDSFLLVCQAYEVLARSTKSKHKKIPRKRINEAVNLVENALQNKYPIEQITRWKELIRSSNRESFSDILERLFPRHIEQWHHLFGCDSAQDYARSISQLRNTLVHMSGKNSDELEQAHYRVIQASYQLSLLFLLMILEQMNLPENNLKNFMSESTFARFSFFQN